MVFALEADNFLSFPAAQFQQTPPRSHPALLALTLWFPAVALPAALLRGYLWFPAVAHRLVLSMALPQVRLSASLALFLRVEKRYCYRSSGKTPYNLGTN